MTSKRVYFLLIAILVVLGFSMIFGAQGISTLLDKPAAKLVTLKAKVGALGQQQTSLVKAKKDIATYTNLYNISRSVVPQNKDEAQTTRQIVAIASANNVVLQSISFPPSTLGGTAAAAPPPTSSNGTAAAPSAAPTLSQLVKVPNIPGIYDLLINVDSDSKSPVTFSQLIGFLAGLEQNRLTAEVSNISISPTTNNTAYYTFSLTLNCYIKP